MLIVYLLPHGGDIWSFQRPWRLAGWVPGLEAEIRRYLPNWKYRAASCGSFAEAKALILSSVGSLAARVSPRKRVTRRKRRWCSATWSLSRASKDLGPALA